MRISLIFPMMVFILLKFRVSFVFICAIALSSFTIFMQAFGGTFYSNYFDTIHYMGIFIIGFLGARKYAYLINYFNTLTVWKKFFLYILAFFLYTYPFYNKWMPTERFLGDWFIALGSMCFIIMGSSSMNFSEFLKLPVFTFLGKISYSLYLVHFIILCTCINLFYGESAWYVIYFAVLGGSIFSAWILHYWVEKPAIVLEKAIFVKI